MSVKAKILIIEDQIPVAITMMMVLAGADCETKIAQAGARAIRMPVNESSIAGLPSVDQTLCPDNDSSELDFQ
jgi:hypothetical protein